MTILYLFLIIHFFIRFNTLRNPSLRVKIQTFDFHRLSYTDRSGISIRIQRTYFHQDRRRYGGYMVDLEENKGFLLETRFFCIFLVVIDVGDEDKEDLDGTRVFKKARTWLE